MKVNEKRSSNLMKILECHESPTMIDESLAYKYTYGRGLHISKDLL